MRMTVGLLISLFMCAPPQINIAASILTVQRRSVKRNEISKEGDSVNKIKEAVHLMNRKHTAD